jgi:hypothetical protein
MHSFSPSDHQPQSKSYSHSPTECVTDFTSNRLFHECLACPGAQKTLEYRDFIKPVKVPKRLRRCHATASNARSRSDCRRAITCGHSVLRSANLNTRIQFDCRLMECSGRAPAPRSKVLGGPSRRSTTMRRSRYPTASKAQSEHMFSGLPRQPTFDASVRHPRAHDVAIGWQGRKPKLQVQGPCDAISSGRGSTNDNSGCPYTDRNYPLAA